MHYNYVTMKASEFVKNIKTQGCYVLRHGGSHDIWINPATGGLTSISRHETKELGRGVVGKMKKELRLK
jgi:predicted RNA binding protein YcfA (HicA-like mRNA interferase family)